MPDIRHLRVDESAGRADRALARALPDLSRARIQALMRDGQVRTPKGLLSDPSAKLAAGTEVTVTLPDPVAPRAAAETIPLDIVYEDHDLLVVNKPPGMVVHPAPGSPGGTLVNALLAHCGGDLSGIGGVARPGIVHRLDKDTSGLMVVAKSDHAHNAMVAQLKDRSLSRVYLAVVWGRPRPDAGSIDAPIGRSPANRKKMAVVRRGGKKAVTHYRLLRPLGVLASLVECRLETGRTHQIRVHMAEIGHPLLGDPAYGRGRALRRLEGAAAQVVAGFRRQALHAAEIAFWHPGRRETLHFSAPPPADMKGLIAALESPILPDPA